MTTRHPGRRRQHRATAHLARTYAALARLDAANRGCTCRPVIVRRPNRNGTPVVELAHDADCPVVAHGTAHSIAVLPKHARTPTNPARTDEPKRPSGPAHQPTRPRTENP